MIGALFRYKMWDFTCGTLIYVNTHLPIYEMISPSADDQGKLLSIRIPMQELCLTDLLNTFIVNFNIDI